MTEEQKRPKLLGERVKPGDVVLVSACLLGVHCRYDGSTNPASELQEVLQHCRVVPICPEQLGGMSTPRPAAEFESGDGERVLAGEARVVTRDERRDVTECFLRGASAACHIARLVGARVAILKDRSPSCGVNSVYCQGERVPGQGVTAAMLAREGLELIALDPPKKRCDEQRG